MNRRSFMASILAAGTAPYVVTAAGVLMPVKRLVVPEMVIVRKWIPLLPSASDPLGQCYTCEDISIPLDEYMRRYPEFRSLDGASFRGRRITTELLNDLAIAKSRRA